MSRPAIVSGDLYRKTSSTISVPLSISDYVDLCHKSSSSEGGLRKPAHLKLRRLEQTKGDRAAEAGSCEPKVRLRKLEIRLQRVQTENTRNGAAPLPVELHSSWRSAAGVEPGSPDNRIELKGTLPLAQFAGQILYRRKKAAALKEDCQKPAHLKLRRLEQTKGDRAAEAGSCEPKVRLTKLEK
ncbi:hypothetical protein WMY93_030972 [Mugilogobius chulae]|uniref:Uncharacterized protein n=1 Tax=Mugilogobius chulae TaxID=88201 RepID=A0AAW0MQG1_9GOBI